MKRLFFGLFAAAIAIGGSAFTNAAPKPHLASFYYVLNSVGTYTATTTPPNTGNCRDNAPTVCWLEYSASKGDSFPSNQIPTTDLIDQSPTRGLYQ